jgi:hypothetical protein
MTRELLLKRIRILLGLVAFGLVISGLTAVPIESELRWITSVLGADPGRRPEEFIGILRWLVTVRDAVSITNARYPFLAYGTDWLALGHVVIAVAFIGALRDPIRNSWVVGFGLFGCAGVVVVALLAGPFRGIPFYWRLIDCSFGVACALPLLLARRYLRLIEAEGPQAEQP